MEEAIREILKTAEIKEYWVHNATDHDHLPRSSYKLYFDPYNHDWRSKEQALAGYVLKKLVPIIEKVIKDGK